MGLATIALWAGLAAGTGAFVDPRDDRSYPLVELAGIRWFAANLAYETPDSYCANDEPANCDRFGRLYTWHAALAACPPGTHLSTEDEWQRLEAAFGMDEAELAATRGRGAGVGDRLKRGGDSGLDVVFGGWRRPDGTFTVGNGHDEAAALWVADVAGPETAWHRDLSSARSVVWRSPVDFPYALSVRCVVDLE